MSLRNITKSFYRSGFRGWMRGPLSRHIPHPKPGQVTGKAVILAFTANAEALTIDIDVKRLITIAEAKALTIDIDVKALTIKGEAVI
jgi:hypothetical protein